MKLINRYKNQELRLQARVSEAVNWFVRMRQGSVEPNILSQFNRWLEADPVNARAYRRVSEAWNALETLASTSYVMEKRRDALAKTKECTTTLLRSHLFLGWTVAALSASVTIVAFLVWFLARPVVYVTGIGERRTITLPDQSRVILDGRSRISVAFGPNQRSIELEQGQAQFDVAKDPMRPFRVRIGDQTVVALGTRFNIDLVEETKLVTLIEGRITVTGVTQQTSERHSTSVELTAGQGLKVTKFGVTALVPIVDLGRVTAWQSGIVVFDNERLSAAAERMNRYSKVRIDVDPAVSDLRINGVFATDRPGAFTEAITAYFPVIAKAAGNGTITLAPHP